MNRFHVAAVVTAAVLLSGCIVQDEVTTISVWPDGSATLVVFHSNVRSTEEGSKADEELRQYVETFDARSSDDFVHIRQAGGESIDGRWLQREAPYSNLISARLPNAAALDKLCSIEGKDDELRLTTRHTADGARRKLTMVALPPRDFKLPDSSARSPADIQQDKANGFSETRLVVVAGEIIASNGWTVASDKRSALLSLDEIARLLRTNPTRIELFIEWQVTSK